MKSTNSKLTLSQETLRSLTEQQPQSTPKNMITLHPICDCSMALQAKAGTR